MWGHHVTLWLKHRGPVVHAAQNGLASMLRWILRLLGPWPRTKAIDGNRAATVLDVKSSKRCHNVNGLSELRIGWAWSRARGGQEGAFATGCVYSSFPDSVPAKRFLTSWWSTDLPDKDGVPDCIWFHDLCALSLWRVAGISGWNHEILFLSDADDLRAHIDCLISCRLSIARKTFESTNTPRNYL